MNLPISLRLLALISCSNCSLAFNNANRAPGPEVVKLLFDPGEITVACDTSCTHDLGISLTALNCAPPPFHHPTQNNKLIQHTHIACSCTCIKHIDLAAYSATQSYMMHTYYLCSAYCGVDCCLKSEKSGGTMNAQCAIAAVSLALVMYCCILAKFARFSIKLSRPTKSTAKVVQQAIQGRFQLTLYKKQQAMYCFSF